MFFAAYHALEKIADYSKLADGSWAVEIQALKLRVTGSTPTDCRFKLLAEFDDRLAALILDTAHERPADHSQLSPRI